jgi:hypothetical protein
MKKGKDENGGKLQITIISITFTLNIIIIKYKEK